MNIDQILRDGAGPEFCELYEAVKRWRTKPGSEVRQLCLIECYDACEAVRRDFGDLVDKFAVSDGTPGEMTHPWIPK